MMTSSCDGECQFVSDPNQTDDLATVQWSQPGSLASQRQVSGDWAVSQMTLHNPTVQSVDNPVNNLSQ